MNQVEGKSRGESSEMSVMQEINAVQFPRTKLYTDLLQITNTQSKVGL